MKHRYNKYLDIWRGTFSYQDLREVLRYAKEDASSERIVIGTNGSLCLQESLWNISQYVDGLVIAINGYNLQNLTYLRNRGSFQKAITAIENAILIGLNTIMFLHYAEVILKSYEIIDY